MFLVCVLCVSLIPRGWSIGELCTLQEMYLTEKEYNDRLQLLHDVCRRAEVCGVALS